MAFNARACQVDRGDAPSLHAARESAGERRVRVHPQVAAFVERYMPAYKAYLPGLYRDGPTTARSGHWLRLAVGADRRLLSAIAM